jgi:hypothetical protein
MLKDKARIDCNFVCLFTNNHDICIFTKKRFNKWLAH